MRYLSVCSGIGSDHLAWGPLGWECAAFAEIDPQASAVLAHRFPDIPNAGDFTTIQGGEYGPIDLIAGGTPCQSFSVAGLRGGLDDRRGNLTLEYCRLVDRVRPTWFVWENVPGILSSNGGRDFGSFLRAMVELRYSLCWRILDAQFVRVESHPYAVPQRRRRVFVVGYFGNGGDDDWRAPTAVLFEREGMSRSAPPRRKAGKAANALTATGVGTCGADDIQAQGEHLVTGTITSHTRPDNGGGNRLGSEFLMDGGLVTVAGVAGTVTAGMGRRRGNACGDNDTLVAATVTSKWAKQSGGPAGHEEGNLVLVPESSPPLTCQPYGDTISREDLLVAHSLTARWDSGEDGTGRGLPLVAFSAKDDGQDAGMEVAPTLRAMGAEEGNPNGGGQVAVVFDTANTSQNGPGYRVDGVAMSLDTGTTPAIVFDARQQDVLEYGDKTGALDTNGYSLALAVSLRGRDEDNMTELGDDVSPSLRSGGGGSDKQHLLQVAGTFHGGSGERGWMSGADMAAAGFFHPVSSSIVRRITPLEAERLQGLPDDWTQVEWKGKPMADGPRYRLVGNAWAINVPRWIGERIQMFEGLGNEIGARRGSS